MSVLVVARGKAGSGKSTLAAGLATAAEFCRVDCDAAMIEAYTRYPIHVRSEGVRDLCRQEGRIVAGIRARPQMKTGTSVVCDADIRDARELAELVHEAGLDVGDPRLLVLRLDVSYLEARRRKLTPEWAEFREDPGRAARFFDVLWNYTFLPIEGEVRLEVDGKPTERLVAEATSCVDLMGRPGRHQSDRGSGFKLSPI